MYNLAAVLLLSLAAIASASQALPEYDYFSHNRLMIRNGVQAVLMCNGLFTSHRTLEQVFAQELAYLPKPVGDASGGTYRVNRGQHVIVVPPHQDVIVRRGLDSGRQGFDEWDLTREVLKAFPR